MAGSFYVIQCPECGNHQADEVRTRVQDHTFKCRMSNCKTTRKLKMTGSFGLSLNTHGPYAGARHAGDMVRCLNVPGKKFVKAVPTKP